MPFLWCIAAGTRGEGKRFYIVWRGSLTVIKPAKEKQYDDPLAQPLEVAGYYTPGTAHNTQHTHVDKSLRLTLKIG